MAIFSVFFLSYCNELFAKQPGRKLDYINVTLNHYNLSYYEFSEYEMKLSSVFFAPSTAK